ncbi:site-specific integrase [Dyadobacter sp. MSC1_007]|jgi:integrase/recombinase XerD|uniref:hypothetical protein n=1 Tax=Dyadobacter sp. MSC1_007 TaxID=2909264 RepID=UPI00202DDDCA|nr:hypothetical protein [Dyadobacter sp. MSC1_007]
MRISDLLRVRWNDFQNERLHYEMGKNNKGGSLKVPDRSLKILDQYKAFRRTRKTLFSNELKGADFTDAFSAYHCF